MLFNSFTYLVFLPVVVLLYWLAPSRWRRHLLLVASYLFYMSWLPLYGLLVGAMTVASFLLGRWMAAAGRKKPLLVLAVALSLSLLLFFRYTGFILRNASALTASLGLPIAVGWFERIVTPLGISFFTFEIIHYLVDVYRGGAPVRSLLDLALFVVFFPTQIAGPIKRYQHFVPQLEHLPTWDAGRASSGLALVVRGLFKKVILADTLAAAADLGFGDPAGLGLVGAWSAVLAFAFQIYFDFSGYTDIGRGSAMLLGFSIPENFRLPYLAANISDFWRRWHMTLSQWLRDYVYIPLGGSWGTRWQTYRNLFVTMVLGGLWHGANWTFAVWGAYHGFLLVLHHALRPLSERLPAVGRLAGRRVTQAAGVVATFVAVCIGWVPFRAASLTQAGAMLGKMFSLEGGWMGGAVTETLMVETALIIIGHASLVWLDRWLGAGRAWPSLSRHRWLLEGMLYALLIVATVAFPPQSSSAFIYFRF